METKLKYTLIKSRTQYDEYCERIHDLLFDNREENTDEEEDEIDLLTMLIEKYNEEHSTAVDVDPVQLLQSFLDDHNITAEGLAKELSLQPDELSDTVNYKRGFSKEVILALANRFKVRPDAFNQYYELKNHPLFGTFGDCYGEVMNSIKTLNNSNI